VPQFSYEAINEAGNTIRGDLEASDAESAKLRLVGMGYIPVAVRRGGADREAGFLDRLQVALSAVKPQELILFTKQFKTMLAAGLSMIEILRVLEQQTENPRLRKICGRMSDEVKKGASISQALAVDKHVFSPLYVSMVRAGETAGRAPGRARASHHHHQPRTSGQIRHQIGAAISRHRGHCPVRGVFLSC